MGGRLVSEVVALTFAGKLDGLSDNALRVLTVMATVARDKPTKTTPGGLYYGGWEFLAAAVFRRHTYGPSEEERVRRAVAELVAVGILERTRPTKGFRRQAYRVTLPPIL